MSDLGRGLIVGLAFGAFIGGVLGVSCASTHYEGSACDAKCAPYDGHWYSGICECHVDPVALPKAPSDPGSSDPSPSRDP